MAANESLRIAEVERLTGVGRHTLRAWERRYGVPIPARTGGHHRMYSFRDVEMVKRMAALSLAGVPLARAAEIALAELADVSPDASSAAGGIADRLVTSLLAFDETEAAAAWTAALDLFDVQTAFERVIVPVMREVGQAWHDGTATVAQEHFATNFVRSRLDMLSRQVLPMRDAPVVLLACLEGEHHELGLLMLAVLLRFHGFRTIYLGQDVPDDGLIRCVEDSQPTVLAVNAGTVEGVRHLEVVASALKESAPLTAIVFGGGVFEADSSLIPPSAGHYGGPDLNSALQLITRLCRERPAGGLI